MATLILICGLPGAGKTTLAKRLEASRRAVRLCPDGWIKAAMKDGSDKDERSRLREVIEGLQWTLALKLLALDLTVILENGFWSRGERENVRAAGQALGARVELHYLNVPPEELWRRIERRNAEPGGDSFHITREELEQWRPWFHVPVPDEVQAYNHFEEWISPAGG
jgi:predicted kinase